MAGGRDESRKFALFSLQSSPRQPKNPVSSNLKGLRIAVHRSDIPEHALSKTRENREVLNRAWVPCNKPSSFKHRLDQNRNVDYQFPNFGDQAAYQGKSNADKCEDEARHQKPPDPHPEDAPYRSDCKTSYQNFIFPRGGAIQGFPNFSSINASSSGVGGGGVIRGVFRVPANGRTLNHLDEIRYVDHNVPCGSDYVAKWDFVGLGGGVRGWAPRRDADFVSPPPANDRFAVKDNGGRTSGTDDYKNCKP
jgi:hypothetical protein